MEKMDDVSYLQLCKKFRGWSNAAKLLNDDDHSYKSMFTLQDISELDSAVYNKDQLLADLIRIRHTRNTGSMTLAFSKYKGLTPAELVETDKGFAGWLLKKCMEKPDEYNNQHWIEALSGLLNKTKTE